MADALVIPYTFPSNKSVPGSQLNDNFAEVAAYVSALADTLEQSAAKRIDYGSADSLADGLGVVSVEFSTPFAAPPAVTVQIATSGNTPALLLPDSSAVVTGLTTTGFSVKFYEGASSAANKYCSFYWSAGEIS